MIFKWRYLSALKEINFYPWRWLQACLLGLLFIVGLACFIHFRDVRVEHLKIHSTARKYILAQTSFEFPDIESTRLLKEENLRDVGKIYHIQSQKVDEVAQKIQNSLIQNDSWRKDLPNVTFAELLKSCDAVRNVLLKVKFTDVRTHIKMNVHLNDIHQFTIFEKLHPSSYFSLNDWQQITDKAFPIISAGNRYIIELYQKEPLSLVEDLGMENSLRQHLKDSIPLKMTRIEAGSRIINIGDKVTTRHIHMLKGMKKELLKQQRLLNSLTIPGSLAIASILTFIGFFYFKTIVPQIAQSYSKMSLIVAIILITLFLSKLTEYIWFNQSGYFSDLYKYPIFVLFAMLTLSVLLNKPVAMMASAFITLVLNVSLALECHSFLLINLSIASLGFILVKKVRKRKQIFYICFQAWLTLLPFIIIPYLSEDSCWDLRLLIEISTTLFLIGIVGSLTIILLPCLESVFGIVTDMTLRETADPDHPLLRQLNQEAPGTYQHSLRVAALAEEAALAIQANGLFCRVGGLYHDIGKLSCPYYFTENQFSEVNMHQFLTPYESAQIIIDHVKEGVKIAQKYRLPLGIINVIYEHHGTSLVYYFYHNQIKQYETESLIVEESRFRYPGPKPHSREIAIIMIADCVEAAFRSMDEINENNLIELVESIVVEKIRDHQLDHSQLTFDEIEIIKKSLISTLIANAHRRIKYPSFKSLSSWKQVPAIARLT